MEQNLSLYQIFHTVARYGNISKAAKELYISQPAISKSIKKLEENLNLTLFSRSSRGVTLTEEGRLLFEHTTSAFETLETAENSLKRIHNLGMGHIRIGVSSTLCKYLLLPYLKSFIEANPHIKITIDCQSTFHTVKLLEENKIDIGLIGKPSHAKDLHFMPLCTIQDSFVCSKTYLKNLKLRENIVKETPSLFTSANLMLLDEENISRQYIDDYLKENGILTNQILEISNMDLLIEFAKIGLGIACVIKEFVKQELSDETLIEIPLDIPIASREVGFAFSTTHQMNKFAKKFLSSLDV